MMHMLKNLISHAVFLSGGKIVPNQYSMLNKTTAFTLDIHISWKLYWPPMPTVSIFDQTVM